MDFNFEQNWMFNFVDQLRKFNIWTTIFEGFVIKLELINI